MDIKQLQYFLALSRQDHMSITADFLGISQPALSKSIKNLEHELGVELFDRHENRIRLNRNGEEFAVYAQRILDDLEQARHALNTSRYDFRGNINILCHAFADGFIDCVADYMRLNPQILIRLFQSTQGDDNLDRSIDFILDGSASRLLEREWMSMPLYDDEPYILISPRYREYAADVTSLSSYDLREDTFICDFFYSELFDHADLIQLMCRSAGFQPKAVLLTDDFLSKIHMVDEGLGITVLPGSCLRVVRKLSTDMQFFAIDDFSAPRTVRLLRRKDSHLSEAAMDFWEFAREHYA